MKDWKTTLAGVLALAAALGLASCEGPGSKDGAGSGSGAGALAGLSVAYEREIGGLPVRASYSGGKASVSVMWPWIDKLKPTGQK